MDGYMNIALEKTEEFVNGKLRNSYGDAFVRGNNGSYPALYWCSVEVIELIYGASSHVYLVRFVTVSIASNALMIIYEKIPIKRL